MDAIFVFGKYSLGAALRGGIAVKLLHKIVFGMYSLCPVVLGNGFMQLYLKLDIIACLASLACSDVLLLNE